jgi:N-acetylmuramoyl-L-alanine amidase
VPVTEQKGYVNCKYLNVRDLGSDSGTIIGTIKAGDIVTIISELNGWYHVKLADGSYGFIKKDYILLDSET